MSDVYDICTVCADTLWDLEFFFAGRLEFSTKCSRHFFVAHAYKVGEYPSEKVHKIYELCGQAARECVARKLDVCVVKHMR